MKQQNNIHHIQKRQFIYERKRCIAKNSSDGKIAQF